MEGDMITRPPAVIAVALLLGLPILARAQEQQIASLAWLAGCWAADGGEAGSGEQWLPLAGGTMLGVGRTVKDGRTVSHEFMQIRSNAQGRVVFTGHPSGQQEASFVAISLDGRSVTFENLQHDFPQRIRYTSLAADKVAARIEGMRNGALRGIDFPLTRVECGALAGK
jgi:hypothetical protein